MYRYWNPNPIAADVDDCAPRALSKILNVDWEEAYLILALAGIRMGNMLNSKAVVNAVLRQYGFRRYVIPDFCPDCYTIGEFANDHLRGVFVVCSDQHIVAIINGVIYDSWNSSDLIPEYYWYKKEENKL